MSRNNSFGQLSDNQNDDDRDDMWPQADIPGPTTSPVATRRSRTARASDSDLQSRMPLRSSYVDERSSLLGSTDALRRSYTDMDGSLMATPRPLLPKHHSAAGSIRFGRRHHRSESFSHRLFSALSTTRGLGYMHESLEESMENSKLSLYPESRVWYDQVGCELFYA